MITVASKLFVEESAQVDDGFMVKSPEALRVSKFQYIQTRSEYLWPSPLHLASSLPSLIDIA